jgi:hypothetical protein
MKLLPIIIAAIGLLGISGAAEDEFTVPIERYKALPRFGIPDEFYTEHGFIPIDYLHQYEVKDPARKMSHSEKLAAALLIAATEHATYQKYHQSYGVNMRCGLMRLLLKNFPGLEGVKATHDVNPNELPIRDIGEFFRVWLQDDLARDGQQHPPKRDATKDEKRKGEQGAAGQPATRPESKPEDNQKPQPKSEGCSR